MVKAKFNGDNDNSSYQCTEFNAGRGDTISMPNERWESITVTGKQDLFTIINQDDNAFPVQKTIG